MPAARSHMPQSSVPLSQSPALRSRSVLAHTRK
jgi:hypothetical protein